MIYYCIYKDECGNKKCRLRQTEMKYGVSRRNLCTEGFNCRHVKLKYILLTSTERLVCKHRLRCPSKECIIKTSYFTKEDVFEKDLTITCPITNEKINLITEGSNSTCLSIWE